jgi:hypothetical protein
LAASIIEPSVFHRYFSHDSFSGIGLIDSHRGNRFPGFDQPSSTANGPTADDRYLFLHVVAGYTIRKSKLLYFMVLDGYV